MSPTLFNLYIDDLLRTVNEFNTGLAFADDLVIVIEGEWNLKRTIIAVENWSRENDIEVNKDKSAILVVRLDRRTPKDPRTHIGGYPIQTSYKYLGLIIDDSLNFDLEKVRKKQMQHNLKKK